MPIVKHNKLIETSYKLNSREQFFLLYLISKIAKGENEFQEYQMHYSEIEKVLNFDGKRRIANKNEVFELMRRVNSCQISYEKGSRKGESVWFQYYERDDETGMFYFRLSDKLKEYLLELKEHFTQYNIQNIVYLSANGIRMYELLKRYQFQEQIILTVEDIKFYLGIEHQYPKTYDFKRYVLNKTQDELELYTDVKFTYKAAEKRGKTVVSFTFYIYKNVPKHQPNVLKLVGGKEMNLNQLKAQHKSNKKTGVQNRVGEGHKIKVAALPRAKYLAYDFLAKKGVNQSFILNKIFENEKFKYEIIQGFEDLYVRMLWNFLLQKTTAKSKPAAFVSWWKNGRFTSEQVHSRMLENLLERKKNTAQEELDLREIAKEMPREAFETYRKELNTSAAISENFTIRKAEKIIKKQPLNKTEFSEAQFKILYPEVYKKIEVERTEAMEKVIPLEQRQHSNYTTALKNSIVAHCEQWYNQHV